MATHEFDGRDSRERLPQRTPVSGPACGSDSVLRDEFRWRRDEVHRGPLRASSFGCPCGRCAKMSGLIGAVVLVPTAAGRDEDGRSALASKHDCAGSWLRQLQKNSETAMESTSPERRITNQKTFVFAAGSIGADDY